MFFLLLLLLGERVSHRLRVRGQAVHDGALINELASISENFGPIPSRESYIKRRKLLCLRHVAGLVRWVGQWDLSSIDLI